MMSGEGRSAVTHDHRSMMSHDQRPHLVDRGDSVLPNDSASHVGNSPDASAVSAAPHTPIENIPFAFKFKAPSGRVHRLQVVASAGIEELISHVAAKLGSEDIEALGGVPTFEDGTISKSGFALSYLDNEGDTVSITTNEDLVEAISLSRSAHRDKVDLFVHDPKDPPLPATVEPQPALPKPVTPPESVLRERKQFFEEDEEEQPRQVRRQPTAKPETPELIAGVPNEFLLPGAIAGLAVVIIAVFALGRASGSNR